jgi:hypothetical protein
LIALALKSSSSDSHQSVDQVGPVDPEVLEGASL